MAGEFTALVPSRILDTRNGTGRGGVVGKIAADVTIDLTCVGVGGVPSVGVSAVAFILQVVEPDATGHVVAWPQGTVRPETSNPFYLANSAASATLLAKLSADGRVSIWHNLGNIHLLADVMGWFAS